MSTGTAFVLVIIGAVLLFALTAGSPHWLSLRIAGGSLMLAGVLGFAMPRLARGQRRRVGRCAVPDQPDEPQRGEEPARSEPPARLGSARPANEILGRDGPPVEEPSTARA